MGSGSTGVACLLTGRDFIGYELNKDYFNIANKRIAELTGNGGG
ncbi:TPA: DNA methyltransferase [Streptococcus pyogenes]